jgi:aminopeptidase-like protein
MTIRQGLFSKANPEAGGSMYELVERLYPICRSITGDGVRQTLNILSETIPLTQYEVPTGTRVFDWTIPKEWNIRDAYVSDNAGRRVIDFQGSNLHVVSYSVPVRTRMSLAELRPHLHLHPENPEWIPYRTSYYTETWGFCLSQKQLDGLTDAEYEVVIDSSLESGSLTYGEFVVPGAVADEVLFYSHTCHPSLCNDNLSGLAVATFLAHQLTQIRPKYTYRFVFGPGTIGSITWLSRNESRLNRIVSGLVLGLLGDPGGFTYKRSHGGRAPIDRVVEHVLQHGEGEPRIEDFTPYGYDERQFGSPGLRLPIGRLTRSPNGGYPEYHSSADDLTLITAERLQAALELLLQIVLVLERDQLLVNTSPKGEPQLGRRGLYKKTGGQLDAGSREMALLWVLSETDGRQSLLDIASKAKLPFSNIAAAANDLLDCGLLRESTPNDNGTRGGEV